MKLSFVLKLRRLAGREREAHAPLDAAQTSDAWRRHASVVGAGGFVFATFVLAAGGRSALYLAIPTGCAFVLALYAYVVSERGRQRAEDQCAMLRHACDAHLAESKEASMRTRTTLVAALEREIRAPISGVVGLADLLLARGDLSQHQIELVRNVRGATATLQTALLDAIDAAFPGNGASELRAEPMSLVQIVESVLSTLAPVAAEKRVLLGTFHDAEDAFNGVGDPVRIRRVFMHLAAFAIEHASGSTVRVSIARASNFIARVEFTIAGYEVAPELLKTMFAHGRAGDGPAAGHEAQLGGQALSITRRVAESMGGRIGVKPIAGGACFVLDLPVLDQAPSAHRRSTHAPLRVGLFAVPAPVQALLQAQAGCSHGQIVFFRVDEASSDRDFESLGALLVPSAALETAKRRVRDLPMRYVVLASLRSMVRIPTDVAVALEWLPEELLFQTLVTTLCDREKLLERTDALRTITDDLPMRLAGTRALVIADDQPSQRAIGAVLEREGGEFVACSDELDAAVAFAHARIDAVFIDVQMRRTLPEAAAFVFRSRGFQGPLVAVTDDKSEQHARACRAAGFTEVLIKPIKRGTLSEVMRASARRGFEPPSNTLLKD